MAAENETEKKKITPENAAAELISLMSDGDTDGASSYLDSFSPGEINDILKLVPVESRADALLLLGKDKAVELLRETSDDQEDNFMREIGGADTSRIVDTLYDRDDKEAVIDLPPFVVQKMLAHGDDRAREIIEDSMEYLMETRQLALLRSMLVELNPVDIASILDDFRTEDLLRIYRILPKDMATDVFVYLPQEVSQNLLTRMSDKEAGAIIDDLYADDAADLLDEMPSMVVKKLLAQSKPETRAAINHLLQYEDDSAGSIMTVEFVDLKEYYTVSQAISAIRRTGIDKETINNCYVLDAERKLLGMVTLRKLLLSSPDDKVGDLMEENVIIVRTGTDQEEVARLFKKYDFTAMPVCDSENRLVGIVTVDDVMDIIQEEAEEDFSKMAAMAPNDAAYLKTSVWKLARGRILWLLFLMISATFTGIAINSFEDQMTTFLYSFTPLLMGTAGNCGSQSSTTVIRALALNQISTKDFLKVSFKEVRVALVCSILLAIANAVRVILMYWWNPAYDNLLVIRVSVVLGVALICIILIAQLLGSLLPIIAKKIHVDPALMSAPVISTIMDTLSILIYCGIIIAASTLLGWSL
ncbi:MAG TPA: magnesium transporter [Firmicutes bacterium]|nr:magnesium transporter [Bacillota bacterium]